ncbi:hypothetical protein PR048_007368 [Dryococelus australis]|uniref:Uncharacterized protein n=1 Tax=Dryococelus australis TaxID=614101 RepID=A0ABQ9HU30_9NEOP|nr:hypothetical protein PR048_007368 [Dryococelus australis]
MAAKVYLKVGSVPTTIFAFQAEKRVSGKGYKGMPFKFVIASMCNVLVVLREVGWQEMRGGSLLGCKRACIEALLTCGYPSPVPLTHSVAQRGCYLPSQLHHNPPPPIPPQLANEDLILRGIQMRGKWQIPEKSRRPAASSNTIPMCENPEATPSGIEPGCALLVLVEEAVVFNCRL